MCKGNAPLHCATNYLYRLFFSSKFSLLPHLTLLHQHTSDSQSPFSRPSAAFPSSIHTNSQENQSWSQICLNCSDTPLSQRLCPAMLHGLSSHWFCSLQLSGAFRTKNFPATLTAQNELRETFPVKLESLCSCMFLSGGCSLCEETFPGLKTEVKDSV